MSSIVTFGSWIIDVDLDKTRNYYINHSIKDGDQLYKNYYQYCNNMPPEESDFFERLAIDPLCCKTKTLGLTREKTLSTYTSYYIAGRYIQCPKEELIIPEVLLENDFIDDRESPCINIGIFQIEFQNPNATIHNIPADLPEGFLCINVFIENIPWLLTQKCEIKMWYPPRWYQLIRKSKERTQSKTQYLENHNALKDKFENDIKNTTINYDIMNQKQRNELISNWLCSFLPNLDKVSLKKYSIYGNRKYSNYLWHAFSYELVPSLSEDDAVIAFSKIEKTSCYLLFNTELIAYELHNANQIKTDIINKYDDVLVFDCDFTWCYCHTHELYCGPYFYNKNSPD